MASASLQLRRFVKRALVDATGTPAPDRDQLAAAFRPAVGTSAAAFATDVWYDRRRCALCASDSSRHGGISVAPAHHPPEGRCFFTRLLLPDICKQQTAGNLTHGLECGLASLRRPRGDDRCRSQGERLGVRASLPQQPLKLTMQDEMAFARHSLQTHSIGNDHGTSALDECSRVSEPVQRVRNGRPPHTEHLADQFLRQRELVAVDAIGYMGGMQPFACSRYLGSMCDNLPG
jgi:hypothetical protein